jgi:hypothetical protein
MGQMLRGGRSWPSDRKVGAGAAKWGKTVAPLASGDAIVGASPINGGAEQDDKQWRPLSAPLWLWSCCSCDWSYPAALALSWPCAWTTTSECEAGRCSHGTVAAVTPRRGSSIASSMRMKIRSDFTVLRLARSGTSHCV